MLSAFASSLPFQAHKSPHRTINRVSQFPKCALRVPIPGTDGRSCLNVSLAPAAAYAVYLPYIAFFSAAHSPELAPQHPLWDALQLSINFNFVLPLAFPNVAPALNPVAEALFNATVAYAVLFIGFALDVPRCTATSYADDADADPKRWNQSKSSGNNSCRILAPSAVWAVLLVPILTNITWLPYLALRASANPDGEVVRRPKLPSWLLRVSESWLLPLYSIVILAGSVAYFLTAHPSLEIPADVGPRLQELALLCRYDILSSSFAADCVAFALFQGWLVDDDRVLRGWNGPRADRASVLAKYVPFIGLAWYLLERAVDPAAHNLHDEC